MNANQLYARATRTAYVPPMTFGKCIAREIRYEARTLWRVVQQTFASITLTGWTVATAVLLVATIAGINA